MEQLHNNIAYTLSDRPPIRAVGYKRAIRGKLSERQAVATAFWKELENDGRLSSLAEFGDGAPILGVSTNFLKDGYDFFVCVETEVEPPEGMEALEIPGGLFAQFQCEHSTTDAVRERWAEIYENWFFRSGYGHLGTAEVEVYTGFGSGVPCQLRAPVKKLEVKTPPRFGTGKRVRDLFVVSLSMFAFMYLGANVSTSSSAPLLFGAIGIIVGVVVNQYLKRREEEKKAAKKPPEKNSTDNDAE